MSDHRLSMLLMLKFFIKKMNPKKLILITLGIMLMGLVETVGVASIMPFLAVVSKPEIIEAHSFLSKIYHMTGFDSVKMFVLVLGGIVLSILVLGNLFSAFMTWCILRFSLDEGKKIALELFRKYISQPYPFFLRSHSTHLSKNILTEVDRLTIGILLSALQSISKALSMLCLLGLLLVVDPFFTLIAAGVLVGSYSLIYRLIKNKIINAGRTATDQNIVRYQMIYEIMGAIKELKVLNRSYNFLVPLEKCSESYVHAETLNLLSPLMTRYFIEAIAFGGMVLVTMVLIIKFEDFNKFIPILGLYALAGYRLMPALQQFYTNFMSLGYNRSALEVIYKEMQLPERHESHAETKSMKFKSNFRLNGVSYIYPEAATPSLQNVNLTIPKTAMVGFVGSSGAGKTTIIDLILGLLVPTSGQILVDDQPLTEEIVSEWQKNIGYVPQSINLLDASIAENIALGIPVEKIDMDAVKEAARLAKIDDFIAKELSEGYSTKIGERGVRLSGGQRQRIGIARALYHDPELLILDEATSALDNTTETLIMNAIKSLAHKKTIIVIAHRLNTVKDCDEIFVLDQGKLVGQDSYKNLMAENRNFQNLANAALVTE